MGLVLTVAVTSTENRKKKTIPWVVILEAQSQAYCGRMNEMVKFFDMIPFSALSLTLFQEPICSVIDLTASHSLITLLHTLS